MIFSGSGRREHRFRYKRNTPLVVISAAQLRELEFGVDEVVDRVDVCVELVLVTLRRLGWFDRDHLRVVVVQRRLPGSHPERRTSAATTELTRSERATERM